jgi:hypothetical protein
MCSQITYYAVNIEADNASEAIDISNNIDYAMFTELPETDWQIEEVTDANETMIKHYITVTKEGV